MGTPTSGINLAQKEVMPVMHAAGAEPELL